MCTFNVFVVFLTLSFSSETVRSHGTHPGPLGSLKANQDKLTSASLNDALLSYLCRGKNGIPCSGHGQCSGGMCVCDRGYSGIKCDVNSADVPAVMPAEVPPLLPVSLPEGLPPTESLFPFDAMREPQSTSSTETSIPFEPVYCTEQDESICSGRGLCHGGRCVCDQGFSGTICELSSSVGFCKTYKECAECTAFMTSCPHRCTKMGSFYLVYDFPNTGSPLWTCRFRSSKFLCSFLFQKEYEEASGYKSIMVRPCLDYSNPQDTNTTTEQIATSTVASSAMTSHKTTTEEKSKAPSSTEKTDTEDEHSKSDQKKAIRPHSGSSGISYNEMVLSSLCILAFRRIR